MSYRIGYRPEIDGLRALAIVAVILFHLGFKSFPGGFVGVDVFFVISGYLITKIIVSELHHTGTFSFANFYARRARRLLPSLFFTFSITLILSFVFLPPELLQKFGGSLVHALYSISNFYFWLESGYFDIASEFKPLLHTWSLTVEEQFYMIWPTVLSLIVLRLKPKNILLLMGAIGGMSLYLNSVFADGDITFIKTFFPSFNNYFLEGKATIFYLLPFRVFEFMIGASLVWMSSGSVKKRWVHELMALTGIGLIVFAVLTYTETTVFPSFAALIPTIGTALIIFTTRSFIVDIFFKNTLSIFIGKISYTLYLIHWPAIVFYKFWKYEPLSLIDRFILMAIMFIISIAVYGLVEKPLRSKKTSDESHNIAKIGFISASIALLLLLPGIYLYKGNVSGLKKYLLDEQKINAEASKKFNSATCSLKDTVEGVKSPLCNNEAPIQVLSIGNSHEAHGYRLLKNLFLEESKQGQMNFVYASTHIQGDFKNGNNPQCYYHHLKTLPLFSKNKNCEWLSAYLNQYKIVANKFNVVIVSTFWPLSKGSIYIDYVAQLQKDNPNLKVLILGTVVETQKRCIDAINQTGNPMACTQSNPVVYYNPHEEAEIRAKWPDLQFYYIDQRALLCGDKDFKYCDILVDKKPIIFDQHHFNNLAIPKLIQKMNDMHLKSQIKHYLNIL